MTFREIISAAVEKERPQLNPSSVKTYTSILFNLSKKLEPDNEDIKFFDDDQKILEHLKEKPPTTRKTVLSALYILTNNKAYNEQMLKDCKHTNDLHKTQQKSQKQEDGWVSGDEIKRIYEDLQQKVKDMFSHKLISNYQTIIDYILITALGGQSGIAPRRSKDYTEMKIRGYNPKTDNYYKAGKFYFNTYKTDKVYGEQVINVKEKNPEFNSILTKWVKCNPTDYLVFSSTQTKLSSPQITKLLNRIFGKRTSVDLLRHIYLTDKYGKIQSEMQKDAAEMSHNLSTQAEYIKK